MKSFDIVPFYSRDIDRLPVFIQEFSAMGFTYTTEFNKSDFVGYPYEIAGLFVKARV
jgi:hypothetical protein